MLTAGNTEGKHRLLKTDITKNKKGFRRLPTVVIAALQKVSQGVLVGEHCEDLIVVCETRCYRPAAEAWVYTVPTS
ncbi:hypothetical protein APTSU1_000503800 [Apodemus speciosus]|uniref:Uncharacterized protein n=1 Tax=Apodemus speciosus TaxID=105296 RepID=A0ABQ0ESD1_APOSI